MVEKWGSGEASRRGEADPGAAKEETAGWREPVKTPPPETTSNDSRKLETEVLRACREALRPCVGGGPARGGGGKMVEEEEAESRRPSESRRVKPLAESRREEEGDEPASNPGGDGRGEVVRPCDHGKGMLRAAEGAGGGAEMGVVDLLASASEPEAKRLGDPTAEGPDTEMEMEVRERECPCPLVEREAPREWRDFDDRRPCPSAFAGEGGTFPSPSNAVLEADLRCL